MKYSFFCGGHGTCWDFVDSNPKHDTASKKDTRDMHEFARKIYENKEKPGVVASGHILRATQTLRITKDYSSLCARMHAYC